MKKLLALLLALMMALSCTVALAEEAANNEDQLTALTIVEWLTIDKDACNALLKGMEFDDDTIKVIDAMIDLVSSATETLVIADNGFEYKVNLGEKEAVALGGELTDTGITFVNTLVPSYVLTVSSDTIKSLISLLYSELGEVAADRVQKQFDAMALLNAAGGYIEDYTNKVMAAISFKDPVEGEYVFDEMTYNVETPILVDAEAMAAAVQELYNNLASDATVQILLDKMGIDMSEAPDFSNMKLPEIDASLYNFVDDAGNVSDTMRVVVNVAPKNEKSTATVVNVVVEQNNFEVSVLADGASVIFEISTNDNGMVMNVSADINGTYLGSVVQATMGDEITILADFYFQDSKKPLASGSLVIKSEGELTNIFDTKGKTVLAIEDIMNGEVESDVYSSLLMDFVFHGMGDLTSAITEVSPDMGELLNSLTSMLMAS